MVNVKNLQSQYRVCPPFADRTAPHLLSIEWIKLDTVSIGMLFHSWRSVASNACRFCGCTRWLRTRNWSWLLPTDVVSNSDGFSTIAVSQACVWVSALDPHKVVVLWYLFHAGDSVLSGRKWDAGVHRSLRRRLFLRPLYGFAGAECWCECLWQQLLRTYWVPIAVPGHFLKLSNTVT